MHGAQLTCDGNSGTFRYQGHSPQLVSCRGGNRVLALWLFTLAILGPGVLRSQEAAPARIYLPNIANEDWSFLKEPERRVDFWDPAKYVLLSREDWYLTFGGEIRIRPEGFRVRAAILRSATTTCCSAICLALTSTWARSFASSGSCRAD